MKIITCLLLVLCLKCAFSQESTDDFPRLKMKTDSRLSVTTLQFYADDCKKILKSTYPDKKGFTDPDLMNKIQHKLEETSIDGKVLSKSFQTIIEKQKKKDDVENLVFGAVQTGVKFKGRVIEHFVPGFGSVYAEANDKLFEYLGENLKENQRMELKFKLEEFRLKQSAEYEKVINNGSLEDLKSSLANYGYFLTNNEKLSKEQLDIVNESKIKFLAEIHSNGLVKLIDEIDITNANLDVVQRNVSVLANSYIEFAKMTKSNLTLLNQGQRELQNQLRDFYNEYQTDKEASNFMQSFLFEKMNPTEKIAALRAGFFAGKLSPKDSIKLNKQLKLEEKKKQVMDAAEYYLNSAATALTILDNLGIGDNSNIMRDIRQGIGVGQQVFSGIKALSSGDYLGAISSITGIFASRRDVAYERHQQIMGALTDIQQDLSQIQLQLNTILEQQQQILRNQAEIFKALVEISNQISVNHDELLKNLYQLKGDIYLNRGLIKQTGFDDKCDACQHMIRELQIDYKSQNYSSASSIKQYINNFKSTRFKQCMDYLNTYLIRTNNTSTNKFYYMEADIYKVGENQARVDNLKKVYDLSIKLAFDVSKSVSKLKSDSNKIYSLYFPTFNYDDLSLKLRSENIKSNSTKYILTKSIFSDLLSPEACVLFGDIISNLHFIFQVTDVNDNYVDLQDFLNNNTQLRTTGKYSLTDALKLTNLCIAQQNLLSGDFLLQYGHEIINDSANSQHRAQLDSLITTNPEFGHNFFVYHIRKTLEENSKNTMQYTFAYLLKDTNLIKTLIKIPYSLTYLPKDTNNLKSGLYIKVNEYLLTLPTDKEIKTGFMYSTSKMESLIEIRTNLLNQISNYELYEDNTTEVKENFNYMILRNLAY